MHNFPRIDTFWHDLVAALPGCATFQESRWVPATDAIMNHLPGDL
jgi:hypothetical protein